MDKASKHLVLITINLENLEYHKVSEDIFSLEQVLGKLLKASSCGYVDGNDYGFGNCVIYLYGPNADSLFSCIAPALKASKFFSRMSVTKRYGEKGASETDVNWNGLT